jgi:hypothetical protein
MSQLLPSTSSAPTTKPKYIDHMQRRYRWVGPRGRHWYCVALRAIIERHGLSLFS